MLNACKTAVDEKSGIGYSTFFNNRSDFLAFINDIIFVQNLIATGEFTAPVIISVKSVFIYP